MTLIEIGDIMVRNDIQRVFNYIYRNEHNYIGVFPNGRELTIIGELESLISIWSFIYSNPLPTDRLYNTTNEIWINPDKVVLIEPMKVMFEKKLIIMGYRITFENGDYREVYTNITKFKSKNSILPEKPIFD